MARKLTPAQRAATTRKARRAFRETFGADTLNVVRRLVYEQSTLHVSVNLGLSRRTVAAIAANYTRGTYDKGLTNCNF